MVLKNITYFYIIFMYSFFEMYIFGKLISRKGRIFMKKLKFLLPILLACLMLVSAVPFGVSAQEEVGGSVSLSPLATAWVSARKPDVALSAGSSTLRVNGDAHDENFILLSFSGDQLAGKNKLTLSLPVTNPAAEAVTVSVIDNYTVDPTTATYNAVKDRVASAKSVCETTLTWGTNTVDLSALLDMTLSDRFTLVIRSRAIGENDNVHSYFYDFEDYALSDNAAFFANPGSNSKKIGYLDGVTTNSLLWRGANTDSNQNKIVNDPTDTTGESRVLSNWIGGTYKSSGRLRPFDALSHDKLTSNDIGKTYRFGFKIMVDNEADNATAKLSMGYAEASSTTFTMTLNNQALAQADGWKSYYVDYTVVADDIPAEDAVTRTNGDRMFVFRIDGGTADAPVDWYIDDMYTVQLDGAGNELCAVVEGDISLTAELSGAVFLEPLSATMVSALRPDVAIGKNADTLRINGGLDDESAILLSFSSDQLAGKNKLTLSLPVTNPSGEIITVGLIDNYTVDPAEVTYTAVADRMNAAKILGTVTLSQGKNAIDLSSLLDMTLTSRFTLVLRSASLGENIHSYFYDFQEYDISNTHAFFKNPSSNNSQGKGYLDGVNNKTFMLRGAETNNDQNYIVADPMDTSNENKVLSNWIGSTKKSSGRLRVFDALSHDVLTTDDIGTTYRFGFKLMIDNETNDATAKFNMGCALATSTSEYYTVKGQPIAQADGWQSYHVDYTIVADDIPPNGEGSREGGDKMFAFNLTGGTADANVNWYIDDIYTVQLDDAGNELCAVVNGDGIRLNAEFQVDAAPTASAYVSSALSSAVFGDHEQVVISGKSDDLAITYLTFNKADLGPGKYAILDLPGYVSGTQEINIFLVDDYQIDEATLDWDKRYTLENCPLIATATISPENPSLIFENPASRVEGEYFTLALCAKGSYSEYGLRLDFEDYEVGSENITVNATSSDATTYSSNYLFRSGGATLNFSATRLNGNMVASYTTNQAYNRFKLYNSFSTSALTADNAGTYRFSFRVKANDDTALRLGTMSPTGTYGSNFYENEGKGTTYNLSANQWTVIEHDIELTADMIAAGAGMAAVNFTEKDVQFCFDDFSVVKLDANGQVTLPIVRAEADKITLRTLDVNLPLADAYAAEDAPTAVYGKSGGLILKSAAGKSSVVAVSYLTEALRSNTILTVPATGTVGHAMTVVAVNGAKVNENTFTYEMAQEWLADSVYVGRYTLGAQPLEIDLQDIKSAMTEDVFTLLFVAEPTHTAYESFEGRTGSDILSSTSPSYNRCYSDTYIISVGGGGSTTADFVSDVAGKDGTTSTTFHVNGYNRRYKFYNTISNHDITVADIGRTFRVSYEIMCTTDSTVWTGLKCATNGNGTTTGPAGGGYEMSTYHTPTTVGLEANVWQTVTFDVTIDQTIVDHQVGIVTIDFGSGTTKRDYYVDNMSVVEIGGNDEGTTSTFASREGDGAGFALSGRGFIDTAEITLDAGVAVLDASVSLLTPDTSASTSDIFRFFDSSLDYTLLSMENDTGKLFFEMDGTVYYLCDGKGVAYAAGEEALAVKLFYDNTAGTVRFAVGEKLAYYTDGETVSVTFALPMIDGGHTGKTSYTAFTNYNDAVISLSASSISADAPRLVGTQTNVVGNAIRVLSGIDTLYYSKVGFMVERPDKETLSWANNTVLTSVNALGDTVTAESLGSAYLSAFILEGLDEAVTGDSVRIIPTAYVGDQIVKGEPVTLVFTVENGVASATVDTTAPDLEGYRTYTMADAEGFYRPLGRVKTEGTSLICDWSASGAEFVLEDCDGDIFVTFDAQGCAGQYLTAFVDGEKTADIVLAKNQNTYKVAEDLPQDTHTVRIVAQYAKQTGNLCAIKFRGTLGTASPADTYVEIIGDSITCGALLSPMNGNYATSAYAYVAMDELESDYAICSRGGQALSVPSRASGFYKAFNSGRDSELYVPSRTADLIVVNLIVNDNWQWYKQNNNVVDESGTWSYENFDAGVAEFFETLEGIHDMENTPIVFVFGCNWTEKSKNFVAYDRLMVLFDEIYYEKYDIKTVRLTGDASASDGGHPCAEAAYIQGQELAAFLRENYPDLFPTEAE